MTSDKKPNLPSSSSGSSQKGKVEKPLTSQKETIRHRTLDGRGFGMDGKEIMPVSTKAKTPPRPPKK